MTTNYIKRFEENLKKYNEKHKTNYTFKDIQEKFIDAGEIKGNKTKCMCIERNF
jgi:hypothetical protein